MNNLKQLLTRVTLAVLIITPMAQAYSSSTAQVPEVILSENPPSLGESAAYVALFLVAAYLISKITPPLPPEPVVCPVVEATIIELQEDEDIVKNEVKDLVENSTELEYDFEEDEDTLFAKNFQE